MKDVFKIKNHQYDFPRDVRLRCRNVNTVLCRTKTIASLGVPKLEFCTYEFEMFKIS